MCNRGEPGSFDCSCFVSGYSQSLRPEMEISAAMDDSPRVKFLCSFGGSILPRPLDGRLRYVGGETRIMNVPRDISYHDLLVRVRELFDGVSLIKYQQPDEDLDALVSVVNDEDVMNMMEEYDKFIAIGDGQTWLRIFLFSQCPDQDVATMGGPHYDADDRKAERRYIDAINNLIDVKSTSPPDVSEHYFGHLSIDGGIPNQVNLCHLTIPSHDQRYSEMDTPRSPALFSPGCFAANDPHEFSPPPSPARFYHEAGEVRDQILEDCIQHTGGHQLHQYDLHCPSTAESYVWMPPGAVLQEKSGFPANLGHSHNMIKGNSLCEHCRMALQRNHCLMPDARFHEIRWKHGLPYSDQPNINEYIGNFPNFCTGCFGSKDPCMPNRDLKMGHGIYVKEHNEQHPMLNDSHNCERGWAVHNNHITLRVEDMRMHQNGTGRISEQYIDGNMMNATHGNINDKQSFPYNCISHNDSHYIQYGANIRNEVFVPQHITGAIPGANVPGFEDAAIRYQNQPSAYGADSPYQGLNNLHPAQSLWRNKQAPFHPGTSHELAGSMIMNGPDPALIRYKQEGSPRFPYVLVDNEIPNALSSQNNCHKLVSFEEFAAADHEHQCDTRTNTNSSDQDVILPLASVYTGLHVKVPSKEIPLVPAPLYQIDKESAISSVTAHKPAFQMQATSKNNMTLEGQEKQHVISNEPDVYITLSPKHKLFEVSIKELQLSEVEEDTNKHLDADSNVAHGDRDMLGENLNFLPELIASVKKAVLEGAEEVVTMAQSNSGLDSTSGKKESLCEHKTKDANADVQADLTGNSELPMTAEHGNSAKGLQNQNANLDVQAELEGTSENEKLCKIELTTAEAEALSKGLQTIKNDDLEEIRQLGSGTFGSVYYGKWRGSDVAIKRIKASCFAGKPSERERLIADFWKEALIMSCLHHPNIVSFYGVVRDGPDGCLATVTEFMVNGSLKQFLQKKDRTVDRRKRLIIAMDVAFGMEYLHEKNIVHFDLKCENLLVNMRDPHRPVCKIGDLGLSKVKQHTLVSGGLRGTLPWMAPELLSGKSNMVSEKIDVYSYGIVMWELLTGEDPYADMRCASIIGGIINNSIRPKIPTWCDPEWKSLMETCWSSDPALRPSFSEISQTLRKMAAAINLK
ncbi:uncharacterized protein LOC121970676 isoform X1 [Zingiber officinale]|uniref:uncharacterized protein LOC121970676 isoform X1 n=1 Tax=Zingiber officinale TaxID=94328 RepID=UPI001C4CF367|nr:uncharacterized protein LOC121970676 isoform X1 [Zingiber officinale]